MSKPYWSNDSLVGLCYWLGYQYSYYPHYHYREAAIVGEFCKLVNAHLKYNDCLVNEVLFSRLGIPNMSKKRLDLVIVDGSKTAKPNANNVKSVVEVKYCSKTTDLNTLKDDLVRLHVVKQYNNNIGCFFMVYSQRQRPHSMFVTQKGNAVGKRSITHNGVTLTYHVRVVKKVTSTFAKSAVDSSYYALLVEVVN
ncbi:hypothetical protein [Aliivibrio fischeri]|uniref:Restriction endonuclease type IV Mrr domain-containing protein n=1 Tax=Aliivibrio fischeri SR5 TaxID=1088719 RepID=A0AAV3ENV7_ALIFS|nr:hypothetical protein [Aliivibrio fischeri]EHN68521.1 hypothetical protein VFSR5_A0603 [Aliivibrio fischeri SR5]